MGMSTHVVGVRNLDGKFAQMMKVKKACEEADVDYPPSLYEYFGEPWFTEEELERKMEEVEIYYEEYSGDGCVSYEVDISAISEEIKLIRFKNCW